MFDSRQIPPFPRRILTTLKAPGEDDSTDLEIGREALKCASVGKEFPFIKGVPSLYMPPEGQSEKITNRVRSFYESNPFPSYDGMEEFAELFKHQAFPHMPLKSFYRLLEEVVMPNEPDDFPRIFIGEWDSWFVNGCQARKERK